MSDKLKTCPFCGSKAGPFKVMNKFWPDDDHAIGCGSHLCRAEIVLPTKKEAITAWNNRTE